MTTLTLKVKRYDPETNESRYQEYTVEVDESAALLDAIIGVREYQDPTLAVRCSCRSAICGSCAMRVNGHARLACKTKISDVAPAGETVTVEPMGNMQPIKDLVTDMSTFWDKVKQVQPWLRAHQPPPEREHIASPDSMADLTATMNCIMCGCCVSDCTALEVDKKFIGPAALAKAYRFVGDPRETEPARDERLKELSKEGGIWDCTHCFECIQVCPKDIAPMDRILDMRRTAMEAGYRDNNGTRHSDSFARSVKNSGWLNETRVAVESFGLDDVSAQLKMVPTGVRALIKGKLPPILHHKRPGAEHVKRIFEEMESQ
ncbi:MAG: succinate dehydrogenase/fumarate reductase iron-sulfur subunit [Dehalococcoidia bacterium]